MAEAILAITGIALLALMVRFWRTEVRDPVVVDVPRQRKPQATGVTFDDMKGIVDELAPTLRPASHVVAPQSNTYPGGKAPADTGHVWSTPCGKKVYIN